MPTIFEWKGYRFLFFSNEGNPLEKRHVHVRKGKNIAKFWIENEIFLASSWGMSAKELNDLEKVIQERIDIIRSQWDEYFNKRSTSR